MAIAPTSRHLRRHIALGLAATLLAVAAVGALAAPATAAARPKITTTVHDAAHVDQTNAPIAAGTEVHLVVAVAGKPGQPVAGGTVDISRFENDACTGTAVVVEADLLVVGGSVESAGFVTTGATFSWRAHYDGDVAYRPGDAACRVVTASTGGGPLTLDTSVHDAAHADVTGTTMAVGSVVHVQVILNSGGGPAPTSSLEIKYWSGSALCPGHATSTQKPVAVVDGVAESMGYTLAGIGGYSYKAVYRGDANYPQTVGPCVSVSAG